MRIADLLPRPVRYRARQLRYTARDLRRALKATDGPVFASLHSDAELEAFRLQAVRDREALRAKASGGTLHSARVVDVVPNTDHAVTIVLDHRPQEPFVPGQFLTFEIAIDGEKLRRSYSLCGSPLDNGTLAVSVKRVQGGRVSNWLNDHVEPGMELRFRGPNGRFGTTPSPDSSRRVILVGGGSGITPLWSLAQTLRRAEPKGRVELVFANRSPDHIMFRDELDELAAADDGFTLTYIVESGGEPGMICGRIGEGEASGVLPVDPDAEYFVCGPDPMMDTVVNALAEAEIPSTRVHTERFAIGADASEADDAIYSVAFDRSGKLLQVSGNSTLLEAAQDAGIPLPFSCAMGGCAECKTRVIRGETVMLEPNCLSEEERAQGWVLACVCKARSAVELDA